MKNHPNILNNIPNKTIITKSKAIKYTKSLISINLSPHLICASEKRNNYKCENTNYNYLSISESDQRNTLFSNTNKNSNFYSLNNICFKEAEK